MDDQLRYSCKVPDTRMAEEDVDRASMPMLTLEKMDVSEKSTQFKDVG